MTVRSFVLSFATLTFACVAPSGPAPAPAAESPATVGGATSAWGAESFDDLCVPAAGLGDATLKQVCSDVRYLGLGTFTGLGLVPDGLDIRVALDSNAEGRDELAAPRHFFVHEAFDFTLPEPARGDAAEWVLRSVAAIHKLRTEHPAAYQFIAELRTPPPGSTLRPWKNQTDKIFVSFDRTPASIAASATLLGNQSAGDIPVFSNFGIISLDVETLRGELPTMGSGRIYQRPTPVENFRAYMMDGVLFSLVHEAAHLHITHRNSTSARAGAIADARTADGTDAEEVVANATAIAIIGDALSQEMRSEVANENKRLVAKAHVPGHLARWRMLADTGRVTLVVPD